MKKRTPKQEIERLQKANKRLREKLKSANFLIAGLREDVKWLDDQLEEAYDARERSVFGDHDDSSKYEGY